MRRSIPIAAAMAIVGALGLLAALALSPTHQRPGLGAPSSGGLLAEADANHLAGGDVECVVNSSGRLVVGVRVDFAAFSDSNKPIAYIDTSIFDAKGAGGRVGHVGGYTFPGNSGSWPASGHFWFNAQASGQPFAPTAVYEVRVVADWPHRGDSDKHVFVGNAWCPSLPPKPTPTPTPTPVPTPTPPPACPAGQVPTPGMTPPAGCHVPPPPPAPPRYKTVTHRVVIRAAFTNTDPHVRPPAVAARAPRSTPGYRLQTHCVNEQGREVRCPHGTVHTATWLHLGPRGPHALRHLRWYVDGRRIRSTRFSYVPRRWGPDASLALFDLPVWGGTWARLTGRHVVAVRGTWRERVRVARAARSSWSQRR